MRKYVFLKKIIISSHFVVAFKVIYELDLMSKSNFVAAVVL